MELINLLSKRDKKIVDRKKLIRIVLLLFAFLCMAYSITSGFFFVEAILLPFPLPFALVVLIAVGTAILVDIGQTMAVTHLAIDYYEDKVVDPYTSVIAVVFIVLSGYVSISGTQTRHDKLSLENVRTDSTSVHLEKALATSAPIVNKVVKTKDITWTEYEMLKKEAELAKEQAELKQDQVAAATALTKELKSKKDKEAFLVKKLFNASAFTLVAIQIVFLFCVFGAGYFKVVTGQSSSSSSLNDDDDDFGFPSGPRHSRGDKRPKGIVTGDLGGRTKINHLGSHTNKDVLHNDCVNVETQSIVLNGTMCKNCGQSFVPKHPLQKFCSNKGPSNCKDTYNNKNR